MVTFSNQSGSFIIYFQNETEHDVKYSLASIGYGYAGDAGTVYAGDEVEIRLHNEETDVLQFDWADLLFFPPQYVGNELTKQNFSTRWRRSTRDEQYLDINEINEWEVTHSNSEYTIARNKYSEVEIRIDGGGVNRPSTRDIYFHIKFYEPY